MDNLVLVRVAAEYGRTLAGAVVLGFRDEIPCRFRLLAFVADRPRSLVISLDPARPWTGRPWSGDRVPRVPLTPFAATVLRSLKGAVVDRVEKPAAERRLTFRFRGGQALEVELVPHRANVVLVGADGRTVAIARPSRGDRERLAVGAVYRPIPVPRDRLDPFGVDAPRIEEHLRTAGLEGLSTAEAFDRGLLGIGRDPARRLVEEGDPGVPAVAARLVRRLAALLAGELDPVIETEASPREALAAGTLERIHCQLLPWAPRPRAGAGRRCLALEDAAATAGLFHGAFERAAEERRRAASLVALLDRQLRRLRETEGQVSADLQSFEDPERFRRWGEALLAGLAVAHRTTEAAWVPDPYDPRGARIAVPVSPGCKLTEAAARHFSRHRRARRGQELARRRQLAIAERRSGLEALRARFSGRLAPAAADELEQAMQAAGIPVGLAPAAGRREAARGPEARLEGVRLFLTEEREPVLIGRSGRDNQRLTFRLASPEDFWFHALGVPGAHVIVRNQARSTRPSEASLTAAAEAAAWYSESREQSLVDVQWTRRKYVRKVRGAPPGTVTVKRFETVRVRPRQPAALVGGP